MGTVRQKAQSFTLTKRLPEAQHPNERMMLGEMMAGWLWLATPAGASAVFAVVSVAAAMGEPARAVKWVSAALFLALPVLQEGAGMQC